MNIEVRKAELCDMDLLMQWRRRVLQEVFSIPDGKLSKELEQENRRYYQAAIAREEHVACFASVNQEIVGCGGICVYQEMPSPDNPKGSCAYLMNIYTCPEYRGNGIGREVVMWLVKQAKDRDIQKIYLETSECGRTLYQKMGFCDMHGYMKQNKE